MIIRRRVRKTEQGEIFNKYHASPNGGQFAGDTTAYKILQSGLYCPTISKDYFGWIKHCDKFQRIGNISRRNEMAVKES